MKKKALVITAMMFVSAFCTPVFAAESYEGVTYNGIAVGQVGIFTPDAGGQWNGYNVILGNGAVIDKRATNFHAEGYVGLFHGGTGSNEIKAGVGAVIGNSDWGRAIGTVGDFTGSRHNIIESATGAMIGGTNRTSDSFGNSATGQVGIFANSHNNQVKDIWVQEGEESVQVGSVGAYVAKGSNNTAVGNVGLFTNAGTAGNYGNAVPALDRGNIVWASNGAVILSGNENKAEGNVGVFTGTMITITNPLPNEPGVVSSVHNNTVLPSTGALIESGNNNRAIGSVGIFDMPGAGNNHDSYMVGNTVKGTGAWIQGGNNNLAIGSVGVFKGGMSNDNKVTGTGVVIK